jgi:hypothetical protein
MSASIRRWIFSALWVLALCLLMTGLDARAGDSQAVRKLVAYFAACSENFMSEGQEFAGAS